jgi:hypothetical protein
MLDAGFSMLDGEWWTVNRRQRLVGDKNFVAMGVRFLALG